MGLKILVADDDKLMRAFARVSLADANVAEIKEAASGDEALALFEQEPFDLLILDWDMPGMSGLDVLQAVRERNSDVPVIMVTAEAEPGHVLKAIQLGVSDYVIKPYESQALRAKVAKACLQTPQGQPT